MSYLPSSPDMATLAELLAKYPRSGILLFKVLENVKASFFPQEGKMCELLIAYISGLNQSAFCYEAHKYSAMQWGIEEGLFGQLNADIDSADVEAKLKPILHLVKKLTLTPQLISQRDVKAIFEAGWDERRFLDIICLCAVVNCMNRLAIGIGIDKEMAASPKLLSVTRPVMGQPPSLIVLFDCDQPTR
jgi:alkylhydroperoxidase family enzyme